MAVKHYPLYLQESISEETKPGVLKRNPNDTPIIKDNSGYRASPRRIDALVANVPKDRRASVEHKTPTKEKGSNALNKGEPHVNTSTIKNTSNAKLTKSTIKIKPTKSFYGSRAAKTPKGAKRRASSNEDIPVPKKARKDSPATKRTPEKTLPKADTHKITKSNIKVKKPNNFYGANAAKTPKGARPSKGACNTSKMPRKCNLSAAKGKL